MMKELLSSELVKMDVGIATPEEQLARELGDGCGLGCSGICNNY